MGTIRHIIVQVRADDQAVVLGDVPDIDNAPKTDDDTTIYCIKSFWPASTETWVKDHLGNWWRHPDGHPLTHWKRD